MSDYPMLISNKLHSFRNFSLQISENTAKPWKGFVDNVLNSKTDKIWKKEHWC